MKKHILLAATIALAAISSFGQTATYNQQVSCILYQHCTTCHHDGGAAPFSLMSYNDASATAFGIQAAVNSGTMPPWPPNPDYSAFAHERTLTEEEIDIINNWVNGRMPEGTGTPPQPPVYNDTEVITDPDLVLTMPQFTINAPNNDDYRCFVLPTGLTEDVYITEMEIVPGNNEAVHHVLLYQDASLIPLTLDAQDPGPGYTNFGGTGSSTSVGIGAWVPGQGAKIYPNGMGMKLPAGANVIMQVHYPVSANGMQDQTKVNIKYTTGPVREVYIMLPLHHGALNEGLLALPPNETSTFTAQFIMPPVDVTLIDVVPHMHLFGRSITAWATTPANQTIPLIDIPDWDFNWQGFYDFKQLIRLPAGSTLHSTATYDNTSNNPLNPNDPPQWVFVGESTTEEMMTVAFSYVIYNLGDENIVIGPEGEHGSHACEALVNIDEKEKATFRIFPNPATDEIRFSLPDSHITTIRLTNALGQTVVRIGPDKRSIDVSQLPEGIYLLSIGTQDHVLTNKVMVRR